FPGAALRLRPRRRLRQRWRLGGDRLRQRRRLRGYRRGGPGRRRVHRRGRLVELDVQLDERSLLGRRGVVPVGNGQDAAALRAVDLAAGLPSGNAEELVTEAAAE